MHLDDMSDASFFITDLEENAYRAETSAVLSHIDIGCRIDFSIDELAESIARIAGSKGEITLDTTKTNGPPRKLLDISRIIRLE
ncbi:MAG: hypothetical protein ACXIT4_00430 [Erythrobacter sp.]